MRWPHGVEREAAPVGISGLSRRQVGEIGEAVATAFLQSRGASVLDRNLRTGRGEIDLVVSLGGERLVVEVKAGLASVSSDPIYHFDDSKQRQVRQLAHRHGISRIDYIGVDLSTSGVTVRWLPRVC